MDRRADRRRSASPVAIPAGYALARLKLPWRGAILLAFLLPQAVPNLPVYVNIAQVFYQIGLERHDHSASCSSMRRTDSVLAVWIASAAFAVGRRVARGSGAQPRRLAVDVLSHGHAAARRARPDRQRDLRVPRVARRIHRHVFRRRART